MQNTDQGSEKRSYRVILLLIVGLAAFSSAMKELNKVHALTLETGELIAQWTGSPAIDKNEMLVKLDSCDSKILVPPVPPMPAMPVIDAVPPAEVEIDVPAPPATFSPAAPPAAPTAPRVRPRRPVRVERGAAARVDANEVRVLISTEEILNKAFKDAFEADLNHKALKAKNRRHIMIGPEGRDVILKSLHRSITLRSAS